MSCLALFLLLLACNVTSRGGDTGGLGGAAGAPSAGACPSGVTVALSDYVSTQIALVGLDGRTEVESLISTASSETDGLSFALSGDVALPSARPASGNVVLLDRYGTNVVTWLDPRSGEVLAQLPIGTGFEANPQDYLEIDEQTAWITRWGQNPNPGQEPFDEGSDILEIDLGGFADEARGAVSPVISGRIALPREGDLPPRPSALSRKGDELFVTLDRVALDFRSIGQAQIVGFDVRKKRRDFTVTLDGLKSCGRLTPSPDGSVLALACAGAFDTDGNVERLSESAFVLFDANSRPLERLRTFEAEALLGEPIQSTLAFADDTTVLLETQTALGGSSHNRLFSLDLESGETSVLLEASAAKDGTGRGLVFGDVFCSPGCSPHCLLADADASALRVIEKRGGDWQVTQTLPVEMRVGLPPVDLTGR